MPLGACYGRPVTFAADKLGHFLESGYQMYHEAHERHLPNFSGAPKNSFVEKMLNSARGCLNTGKRGNEAVVAVSNCQENGEWGLRGTGVHSYADKVANYEGYKFWKSLTEGENPYFKCENQKWEMKRIFTFGDHISEAWDESANCNRYVNQEMTDTVSAKIRRAMNIREDQAVCPLDQRSCRGMLDRYQGVLREFVSPECGGGSSGAVDHERPIHQHGSERATFR